MCIKIKATKIRNSLLKLLVVGFCFGLPPAIDNAVLKRFLFKLLLDLHVFYFIKIRFVI